MLYALTLTPEVVDVDVASDADELDVVDVLDALDVLDELDVALLRW
jgi:hypothetical protein